MAVDDALNDRKPHPGPFFGTLCGEVRVEYPVADPHIHATARVAYRELEAGTRLGVRIP